MKSLIQAISTGLTLGVLYYFFDDIKLNIFFKIAIGTILVYIVNTLVNKFFDESEN